MSFDNKTEILIYQTEDGLTKVDVKMEDETVWLTQAQMSELFQTTPQNITLHIKNIYAEGELLESSTCKEYLQVQHEGHRDVKRKTKFYNLDVIISVGYRVKSHRGTQFRIWALRVLKEYIIKGFAMNDDLLKKAGGGNYFEELLARVRDIRSSEKVFYRKVLDIYATSIDYSPDTAISQKFFQTVQNKMHWVAHGHTAAEIIYVRADADKPMMGMTNFTGAKPTKAEVQIAKNYLTEEELALLNRIVNAYIEFAELQAIRKKPMYMADWIKKLDDFLQMSDNEILTHVGKISHMEASQKAALEYERYKEKTKNEVSQVEKHFMESIERTVKKLKGKKDGGEGDE